MNRKNILILVSIFTFIILIGGVSYSYFTYNKDIGDVSLTTGEISINLSGVNGDHTFTNVIPLSDEDGKIATSHFDFTVNSTVDTERIYYEVYLLPKSGNTLDSSYIKTYLTDQSDNELNGVAFYNDLNNSEVENGKSLYRGIIETNNNGTTRTETKAFRLRLWVDESFAGQASKTFNFDIYLYAKNVDDNFELYDPCPGCKFMYPTTTMYTTWNTQSQTPTVLTSGLSDSYLDVVSASGNDFFIGVKLNASNQVEKAYSCGLYNGTKPFCIEGYLDDTKYEANKTLLQSERLWNNTCQLVYEGDPDENMQCSASSNGQVEATTDLAGGVGTGDDGGHCFVWKTGYIICNNNAV